MATEDSGRILEALKDLFPRSIDLTLNRPRRLLADLEHPEWHLPPVIHFAGTNGKGSTLAMVRAGLEAAGHAVHAYISPHLARFHERIRLAGELIGEEQLVEVLGECRTVNGDRPITLFEVTTCAAMLAFSRSRADYLLLEVGLGGRLDATNVVERPQLTVISPVSIDHQQYLGNGIAEIAREKAGILKPGVPCIVSRQRPEAMQAIRETASAVGAPLFVQGEDWHVEPTESGLRYCEGKERIDLPAPSLVGPHQRDNAGAALAVLRQHGLRERELADALTGAEWPARMQRLTSGPLVNAAGISEVWLDGGHNAAAGIAVAESLKSMPAKTNGLVCGMLTTKDIGSFLAPLREVSETLYGIAIPGEEASLPASEVRKVARQLGFASKSAGNARNAVEMCERENPGGRILICGSLYLAGSILGENA